MTFLQYDGKPASRWPMHRLRLLKLNSAGWSVVALVLASVVLASLALPLPQFIGALVGLAVAGWALFYFRASRVYVQVCEGQNHEIATRIGEYLSAAQLSPIVFEPKPGLWSIAVQRRHKSAAAKEILRTKPTT